MTAEETYHTSAQSIDGALESQMFGKPCYKLGTKAFVCFFKSEMVFKLPEEPHKEAMSLEGSQLFDPSGKGRAMKEWVQVPFEYADKWPHFAQAAAAYVSS